MPVGFLGFLDVDTDDPPEPVTRLVDRNPTFTVKTPHGGKHHYYSIDGEAPNARQEWGEIRASNWYIVGPGSTIDHGECGDCALAGEGEYCVTNDRPIATIDATDLELLADRSTEEIETDLGGDHGDYHTDRRIQKAKEAKYGDRFTALWEGRYREVGHSDRSTAEAELVARLAFWLQSNRGEVSRAMDRACREYPRADVNGARKWLTRGESYREPTLDLIDTVDRSYSGSASESGFRPDFSKLTSEYVLDALLDIGLASSEEIAAHSKVDRSRSQVQRVLRSYRETGVVSQVRDGRSIRYFAFEGTFLDAEERIEAGID
jgi:DNA-binding transcriptional ArsR family regulator